MQEIWTYGYAVSREEHSHYDLCLRSAVAWYLARSLEDRPEMEEVGNVMIAGIARAYPMEDVDYAKIKMMRLVSMPAARKSEIMKGMQVRLGDRGSI